MIDAQRLSESDKLLECSYCGRKLSQDNIELIGCCPVCNECYNPSKAWGDNMTEVLNANEAVQRPLEFLTCFCGEELEADGDGLVCRNEEYKCPNHGSVFKPVMEWEMRGITRMGREKGILGL